MSSLGPGGPTTSRTVRPRAPGRPLVAALLALMTFSACPERATPQRGIALTFRKPEGAWDLRPVVDRRLAQLSLKAALQEDTRTLTVRVPEGGDVGLVKQLLARRARLAFCAHAVTTAERWCDHPPIAAAFIEREAEGCVLVAPSRPALSSALADAGVEVVLGRRGQQAEAWPVERPCLEPALLAATVLPEAGGGSGIALQVQLDRAGAADFGALTKRLIGHRLLLVLDDELLVAPVVQDAITGGKAMLLLQEPAERARVLAAALAGGPLPTLELVSEKPWGPPSLR